jgi:hypothetical protein
MSLYKNCGRWKNFDCTFEFSVKIYVTNTINLSCAKILLPSVIGFSKQLHSTDIICNSTSYKPGPSTKNSEKLYVPVVHKTGDNLEPWTLIFIREETNSPYVGCMSKVRAGKSYMSTVQVPSVFTLVSAVAIQFIVQKPSIKVRVGFCVANN